MRVLLHGSGALSHYRTHASELNIPLVTGRASDCIPWYYNQIICLLGGVCSNMSLPSHKAISLSV